MSVLRRLAERPTGGLAVAAEIEPARWVQLAELTEGCDMESALPNAYQRRTCGRERRDLGSGGGEPDEMASERDERQTRRAIAAESKRPRKTDEPPLIHIVDGGPWNPKGENAGTCSLGPEKLSVDDEGVCFDAALVDGVAEPEPFAHPSSRRTR
jgi:hypothetical protein